LAEWIQSSSPELGQTFKVTHLNDPVPDMPFTLLGHADFFPEYYISSPNGQPFTAKHISILEALIEGKGNLFQKPKDQEAHAFYMRDGSKISACYDGKWLGGKDPSQDLVNESIKTWVESTAAMMMEKAGDFLKNSSWDWLHLLHPKKKEAVVVTKETTNTSSTCFLGIFCIKTS